MSEVLMVMVECSLRSMRIVDSHVVFGLPVGRFTGLMKCRRDCLAGVSGGSFIRWLNQESLLFIIMTLQGFMWVRLYKSLFDMRRGQLTRITFRSSLRCKESILSSRDVVNVHTSELYKKILSTYALKIRNRMTSLMCLLLKMFSKVLKLSIARPFPRLMSSSESNSEPSNLHFFFQLLLNVLLIIYYSVFVGFT